MFASNYPWVLSQLEDILEHTFLDKEIHDEYDCVTCRKEEEEGNMLLFWDTEEVLRLRKEARSVSDKTISDNTSSETVCERDDCSCPRDAELLANHSFSTKTTNNGDASGITGENENLVTYGGNELQENIAEGYLTTMPEMLFLYFGKTKMDSVDESLPGSPVYETDGAMENEEVESLPKKRRKMGEEELIFD